VRNYAKLQQLIEQRERHRISYWIKLIQDVMVELEGEAKSRQEMPFEEFQKWARTLGIEKGWAKE
jgi:hypothetical protein